jgi:hypothetical protein
MTYLEQKNSAVFGSPAILCLRLTLGSFPTAGFPALHWQLTLATDN